MMRWYWGYGSGMWLYPLLSVLLVVFVIAMIVRMVRYRHFYGGPYHNRYDGPPPPHSNPGGTESAMDILNRRYASGEISKEDFERMKKDIMS